MKVWRLEHREWIQPESGHYVGPYCGVMPAEHLHRGYDMPQWSDMTTHCGADCTHKQINDVISHILDYSDTRPLPGMDGISHNIDTDKGYVCGFSYESGLLDWFGNEVLDDLYEYGYVVRVYEVPMNYVRVGQYQLMFHCAAAKTLDVYMP